MNKRILVISSSLRKDSNSSILADEFARGAADAGNEVSRISLCGKKIGFCTGCLSCQKTDTCAVKDDAVEIAEAMAASDAVVLATPVYFYGMSGQLKTLLDRMNPLFAGDYAFREVYLLAAAADTEESAFDNVLTGLNGWIRCFEKARLAGAVRATGLTAAAEIRRSAKHLAAAYELGKGV